MPEQEQMSKTLEAIKTLQNSKKKRLRNPVTVVGVKKKNDGSYDEYTKTVKQVEIEDDMELSQFVDACESDMLQEGILSSLTTATGVVLAIKYSKEVKSTRPSLKKVLSIRPTDNVRELAKDLSDSLTRINENQKIVDEANQKRQHALAKGHVVSVAMSRLFLKKKKR